MIVSCLSTKVYAIYHFKSYLLENCKYVYLLLNIQCLILTTSTTFFYTYLTLRTIFHNTYSDFVMFSTGHYRPRPSFDGRIFGNESVQQQQSGFQIYLRVYRTKRPKNISDIYSSLRTYVMLYG